MSPGSTHTTRTHPNTLGGQWFWTHHLDRVVMDCLVRSPKSERFWGTRANERARGGKLCFRFRIAGDLHESYHGQIMAGPLLLRSLRKIMACSMPPHQSAEPKNQLAQVAHMQQGRVGQLVASIRGPANCWPRATAPIRSRKRWRLTSPLSHVRGDLERSDDQPQATSKPLPQHGQVQKQQDKKRTQQAATGGHQKATRRTTGGQQTVRRVDIDRGKLFVLL